MKRPSQAELEANREALASEWTASYEEERKAGIALGEAIARVAAGAPQVVQEQAHRHVMLCRDVRLLLEKAVKKVDAELEGLTVQLWN